MLHFPSFQGHFAAFQLLKRFCLLGGKFFPGLWEMFLGLWESFLGQWKTFLGQWK